MPPETKQMNNAPIGASQSTLDKIETIFKMVDSGVSKEDFLKSFELVLKKVVAMQQRNEQEVQLLTQAYHQVIATLTNKHEASIADLKGQTNQLFVGDKIKEMQSGHKDMMAQMDSMMSDCMAKMSAMDKKMASVKNGVDGKPGKDGKNGSPDNAGMVRDKLETLKGSDRLDKSAIRGLEKFEQQITEVVDHLKTRASGAVGSARGFFLWINGTKYGAINNLDFYGTGVSTSVVNGLRRITFAGSGGSGDVWKDVVPTGTINGVNDTFTLADTPTAGSLFLILNGAVQLGGGIDYTLTVATVVFTNPPPNGSVLRSRYQTSSSGTWKGFVAPTGTVDEVNDTFTLANAPVAGSLIVVLNGALQLDGFIDYVLAGTSVQFVNPPPSGSTLYVNYQY